MTRSKQNDLAMSYVATTITHLPGEAPRNTYITDMTFFCRMVEFRRFSVTHEYQ